MNIFSQRALSLNNKRKIAVEFLNRFLILTSSSQPPTTLWTNLQDDYKHLTAPFFINEISKERDNLQKEIKILQDKLSQLIKDSTTLSNSSPPKPPPPQSPLKVSAVPFIPSPPIATPKKSTYLDKMVDKYMEAGKPTWVPKQNFTPQKITPTPTTFSFTPPPPNIVVSREIKDPTTQKLLFSAPSLAPSLPSQAKEDSKTIATGGRITRNYTRKKTQN